MSARWNLEHMPHQAGRTVIVTGANSGLGYITTRELAHRLWTLSEELTGLRM
jgi:NADP-dependent 3-hydroxy acid dehydrogenase YdfG